MKQGEFTLHHNWLAVLFVLVAITSQAEKAVNDMLQPSFWHPLFILK